MQPSAAVSGRTALIEWEDLKQETSAGVAGEHQKDGAGGEEKRRAPYPIIRGETDKD